MPWCNFFFQLAAALPWLFYFCISFHFSSSFAGRNSIHTSLRGVGVRWLHAGHHGTFSPAFAGVDLCHYGMDVFLDIRLLQM
jgi:hypothetical protein